jgi:hypothetical protein
VPLYLVLLQIGLNLNSSSIAPSFFPNPLPSVRYSGATLIVPLVFENTLKHVYLLVYLITPPVAHALCNVSQLQCDRVALYLLLRTCHTASPILDTTYQKYVYTFPVANERIKVSDSPAFYYGSL